MDELFINAAVCAYDDDDKRNWWCVVCCVLLPVGPAGQLLASEVCQSGSVSCKKK